MGRLRQAIGPVRPSRSAGSRAYTGENHPISMVATSDTRIGIDDVQDSPITIAGAPRIASPDGSRPPELEVHVQTAA